MGTKMNNMKQCTECKIELPATLEYFYKSVNHKDRLKKECKSCSRKYALDRLNKMSPEFRKEMKKAEKQRNPHIYRQATRKVVARKRGVLHEDWTEKQLIDTYGTDCYICNKPIDYDAPKVGPGSDYSSWPDHVIPMSRGGENTIRNVRPCHRTCNEHKARRTYDEYIASLAKDQDL
jgi:hypothetical protein